MSYKTYYTRKKQGLCPWCCQPPVAGKTYCIDCCKKQKEWVASQKCQGLCRECSKPILNGKTFCAACLEKKNKRQTTRKSKGLCPQCGKPTLSGKIFCTACLKKRNERRSLRKIRGLCRECGEQTFNRKTQCAACLEKRVVQAAARKSQGLCQTCGAPTLNGKIRCPKCNLGHSLRSRLYQAIKSQRAKKSNKTLELVGCSLDALKKHLESKFRDGMDWNNYGDWHIDHIRPLSSFDLIDPEQQKLAFHYTNLQPLWASENLAKGSRWYSNCT